MSYSWSQTLKEQHGLTHKGKEEEKKENVMGV
jgi:hypothetical protein